MPDQTKNDNARAPISVGIATILPTPYRKPFFERLNNNPHLDMKVYYSARSDVEWNWDESYELHYEHVYMPLLELAGKGPRRFNFWYNPGAILRMRKAGHDVIVIGGYFTITYMLLIFWCIFTGRKFVLWVESHELNRRNKIKLLLKRLILKPIFKRTGAFLAMGRHTKEFLNSYGVEDNRIFYVPNTPDVDAFMDAYNTLAPKKGQLKKEAGVEGKSVILYVGRLAPEKGLEYLIEAYADLKRHNPDLALVLAGRGTLERKLKGVVNAKSLEDVVFTGFTPYRELPKYYAMADVFVLPSLHEPWGVVVNEAMACGLPVVLSRLVGAAGDLVEDGVNGYSVYEKDPAALAKAINNVLKDDSRRLEMGKKSSETIRGFDYSAGEAEFVRAVALVATERDIV